MIRVTASKSKGMIWLEQYQGEKHLGTCGFDYTKAGKVAQKIFHHQGVYWGDFPEKLGKEDVSKLLDKINRAYHGIYSYHEAILSVEPDYVETAGMWVVKISNTHGKLFILPTEKVNGFILLVKNNQAISFADGSSVALDGEQISDLIKKIEAAHRVIVKMNQPITNAEQNCRETVYSD
jgi:hypothetical protein